MKIYKHEGRGHYIGSAVIVTAKSREAAEEVIRGYLDSNGLASEALDVEEFKIKDCEIIYAVNGDY